MPSIDDRMNELKQKRDELKLQIHLGSQEAQAEWNELEKKWNEFESQAQLGKAAEGIGTAAELLGDELTNAYKRLKGAL